MKRFRRLFLRGASSFALNFILMITLVILTLFNVGNVWLWRLMTLYMSWCVLFLNANYFRYIKHKYDL